MTKTKSTVEQLHGALLALVTEAPDLRVIVNNHLMGKHGVANLAAFEGSDITKDERWATYAEIIKAIRENRLTDLLTPAPSGAGSNGNGRVNPAKLVPATPPVEVPKAKPKPILEALVKASEVIEVKTAPSDPFAERFRSLIIEVLGEIKAESDLDRETVKQIVAEALEGQVPKGIEFKINAAPVGEVKGLMHMQLPQIIAWLMAGPPVWTWGPAGSGKTHMAYQAADAMGIKAYVQSIDETMTAAKVNGFMSVASGEYVPGAAYEPFKNGGLLAFDEIDTNQAVMASTNAMVSNEYYMFPNGEVVKRHPDFRVLGMANTIGLGAVAGYTARVRMDASTLDRFALIEMKYDESLETSLALGVPYKGSPWKAGEPADEATCSRWVQTVQKTRAAAGSSVLISPRASYNGVKALRAGIPFNEVADALLYKLCDKDTRARLEQKVRG